jgi:hypothetical protein
MRFQTPVTVLLAGVLIGSGVLLGAQTLGDVARKEEDRRKNVKTGTKVYTNKDLGSVPAPVPVSTPAADAGKPRDPAAGATPAAAATPPATDDGEAKDQKYWSRRMSDLRQQLDRDQTYADALQSRINGLNAEFVNRDDPNQRARIEGDRTKALSELNRLKKGLEDQHKAVAALEEEARRAGVPAGWLR